VFALVSAAAKSAPRTSPASVPGNQALSQEERFPDARLMADSARLYRNLGKGFADHQTVNHSAGEYVRGDAYTNTIEGCSPYSSAA